MSVKIQCRNMVEQQIRTWDVLDDRVLDIYYELPRDYFLPRASAKLAYSDMQAPIGHGQVCLEPKVEARMLQELAPQPNEKILHVGTGSGLFAALLGKLCGNLVTVEIVPELAQNAAALFKRHHINNATVVTADFFAAAQIEGGPFDAAVFTGSLPIIVPAMLEQVAETGRVLAPIGSEPIATVELLRRVDGTISREELFDTWVPPLRNVPQPSSFSF